MKHLAPSTCQDCPCRLRAPLAHCQAEDLDAIFMTKTCQHYQRGQFIAREGSRPLGLYCVHSGHIKVCKVGGDGKEHIIRLVKEGDILGYRSLLAGTEHSADAVALSEVVVCQIPRAEFFRLIERNAAFAFSLMKLMASVLGEAEERMLHMAYKPVRERLAEALLLLLRTYAQPEAPSLVSIGRDDLAALVGTAKETISRFLTELKEEGVLSTKSNHITVLKPARLLEISTLYD